MERVATLEPELRQFSGTDNYYKYNNPVMRDRFLYTDGVQYLASQHNCYWLLDVIFSHVAHIYHQRRIAEDRKEFLACKLNVTEKNVGHFTITDGDDNVLATQTIEYTDFPANAVEIWVENYVALLPSEH